MANRALLILQESSKFFKSPIWILERPRTGSFRAPNCFPVLKALEEVLLYEVPQGANREDAECTDEFYLLLPAQPA
eukprot:6411231-Pyramimonas_sp.AAC.1